MGNFKIIDVCGVSVSVQKCCGVIVGNPHSTPAACADFLAQRRTAAVLFHKLEVKRAFQAKAAARSDVFVQIAMDFRVYAKSNGYIPCECFLSTGKCRFEGRPGQPCRNFPCAQKQHPFVSSRLDKLQ